MEPIGWPQGGNKFNRPIRRVEAWASNHYKKVHGQTKISQPSSLPSISNTILQSNTPIQFSMAVEQFTLPNLHVLCPFEDATNPNDVAVGAESSSWVNSYKVFSDAKRAEFMAEGNEFLTSHCYPYASYERLRGCCDFINTLFVVDEISDVQNGDGALSTGMIYLNVLKDPTWDDGSKLAKLSRESVVSCPSSPLILMICPLPASGNASTNTPNPTASAGSTTLVPVTSTLSEGRPNSDPRVRSSTLPRTRNFDAETAQFTLASPSWNTLSTSISPTRWSTTRPSRNFRTGVAISCAGPT